MRSDIYEQLRKHLDEHPITLHATSSGVELRLLKSLFNQEEAAIALQLSALLERPAKIQERFKRDYISLVELESKLYCLFQKGAIRGVKVRKNKGKFLYSKMPLAIGVFEAQVDKISKETAALFFE